jgi:hypothetical protein
VNFLEIDFLFQQARSRWGPDILLCYKCYLDGSELSMPWYVEYLRIAILKALDLACQGSSKVVSAAFVRAMLAWGAMEHFIVNASQKSQIYHTHCPRGLAWTDVGHSTYVCQGWGNHRCYLTETDQDIFELLHEMEDRRALA